MTPKKAPKPTILDDEATLEQLENAARHMAQVEAEGGKMGLFAFGAILYGTDDEHFRRCRAADRRSLRRYGRTL